MLSEFRLRQVIVAGRAWAMTEAEKRGRHDVWQVDLRLRDMTGDRWTWLPKEMKMHQGRHVVTAEEESVLMQGLKRYHDLLERGRGREEECKEMSEVMRDFDERYWTPRNVRHWMHNNRGKLNGVFSSDTSRTSLARSERHRMVLDRRLTAVQGELRNSLDEQRQQRTLLQESRRVNASLLETSWEKCRYGWQNSSVPCRK
jgi:hypothetical protein